MLSSKLPAFPAPPPHQHSPPPSSLPDQPRTRLPLRPRLGTPPLPPPPSPKNPSNTTQILTCSPASLTTTDPNLFSAMRCTPADTFATFCPDLDEAACRCLPSTGAVVCTGGNIEANAVNSLQIEQCHQRCRCTQQSTQNFKQEDNRTCGIAMPAGDVCAPSDPLLLHFFPVVDYGYS